MIRFTIPGEAVSQLRPRFARRGNFTVAFDPEKSRNYKAYVRLIASEHSPEKPIEGAIHLFVDVFRQPPKTSKKKLAQMLSGEIRPIARPDIDNILKGVMDALKGLIWRDDSQIVELSARKFYSDNPRVEAEISEL